MDAKYKKKSFNIFNGLHQMQDLLRHENVTISIIKL